ncbi:alpha-amylase [Sandaracinomonas limnophila]|uniref:Alpha-amylase n=1 Tax=Sandaracinomonas limnophila TaxID=1862386 RepID=A0A437PWN0_9BACT|nr:alpha-amylase family glycosyl hydrolase [Sandaracinomonas limnophila]RVU26650.1 alpha-amylase [Sandaracinomonas limnophila]
MMFHLWGNPNKVVIENGSLQENGVTKFKDVSSKALKALKKKGITHIYATGLIEHATMEDMSKYGSPLDHPDVVKGRSGSPFAIKDYYDVNPFFADQPENRLDEFQAMLDRIHQEGLKLIIDFVPNHLARNYYSDKKPKVIVDFGANDDVSKSFDPNNNFYYLPGTQFSIPEGVNSPVKSTIPYVEIPAKVSGNNVFNARPSINDWFETVKLNYGVDLQNHNSTHFNPIPDTWNKMTEVLSYWTSKGVDGFRCDMAEMVPVEFWEHAISKTKAQNPNLIFVAEIYQPAMYKEYIFKGGFDYLYDKVGLYDAVRRLMENKEYATVEDITKVWQHESGDFAQHMLRFLENHDEQRINTPSFAKNNLWSTIPGMAVTALLHDGPLMIYDGQEFGEKATEKEGFNQADDRTSMFDFYRIESHQRWMNDGKFNQDLLTVEEKALDDFYVDLMKFAQKEAVFTSGKFFDLQYAQGANYDHKKVYSFLRYTEKEANLVICNFDAHQTKQFSIEIPALAMDMMQRNQINLTKKKYWIAPNVGEQAQVKGQEIKIPANSVMILNLK